MNNYHATHDVFPIGYVAQTNTNLNATSPGWGWASAILPQIEQGPLYNAANLNLPIEDASNSTVRSTALGVYTCPTDRFAGRFTVNDINGNPITDAWSNSYAGNFGRDVNIAKNPGGGNGLFMRNVVFGAKDITDGSGQTILIGERATLLTKTAWAGAINGGTCRITLGSPSRSTAVKDGPSRALGPCRHRRRAFR
jgi:hypothetical protein